MEIYFSMIFIFVFILILIYLSGWFSSTETAITNLGFIDMINLKDDKRYKYLKVLRRDLDQSIISILLMNNIVNVLLSSLPVLFFSLILGELGISILITLITVVIILFGDIIPKSRAINNKTETALKNAFIMYYIYIFTKPIIKILLFLSKSINKMLGNKIQKNVIINDETIKSIVNESQKKGVIKSIEKEIISNVFEFGDLKVKDVYTPKEKVFTINYNYTTFEAREIITKNPFTRVPYLEGGRVIGILYSKTLLSNKEQKIKKILKKTFFVKEEEEISSVFERMKKQKIHLGVVVDKDKKFLGIVTLEDIIEEVLGNIYDEFHKNKQIFRNKLVK